MLYNIPDDWNQQSWACYSLQWPNSTLWTALLYGAISDFKRGRVWDEKSGVIKDAQAVGLEIWLRNHPLTPCAESGECPESVYVHYGGGGDSYDYLYDEDDDMSNCGPLPFETRADGLYFWHCCEWVKIWPESGSGGLVTPDLGDDPLVPEGETPPTYYACGKATAAADLIFKVANAAWDTGTLQNPWEWPGALGSELPELHGGDINWIDACAWAIIANAGYSKSDVIPDTLYDLIKCRMAERFEDDDLGTTDDDYAYIFGLIQDQFPIAADPGYAAVLKFWVAAYSTIGKGDLRNISRMGASTEGECTCPDEVLGLRDYFPEPPATDWYYEFDLRHTLHAALSILNGYFAEGIGIWGDCGPTNNDNTVRVKLALDQINNGSVVTYLHVIWENPGLQDDYNNTSGCIFEIEDTDQLVYADFAAVTGDGPALGGTFTITRVINDPLGAAEDEVQFGINGYHVTGAQLPDLPANSFKLIGFAIGGSGPGPLASPPA